MADKHIEVAITQIGKKEDPIGSNWGPDVKQYLASVGINFPASWCMAFVYWCCKQADFYAPLVKTGGVLAQWNEVDVRLKKYIPQEGDIFIMDFGKGLGHTGFVESVDGEMLNTIEGNSNDEGSREGFEVCRRKRAVTSCKGFIRFLKKENK